VSTDTVVVVLVEGHGEMPGALWAEVRFGVISIFKRINVRIEWDYREPPAYFRADRFPVFLHVAHRGLLGISDSGPTCHTPDAYACSMPFDGSHKIIAIYDREQFDFPRRLKLIPRLLAHATAHEIVHIVAASDRHSPTGIMKERWTRADIDLIEIYGLDFTEKDVLSIQSGLDAYRRTAESKQ
jgi:hypothetical protein